MSHFGLWDIIPPPPPVGTRGNDVLNIYFLFPICIIQKVTILAPKLSCGFMAIGNQMQNHKIESNRELTYEDGSI